MIDRVILIVLDSVGAGELPDAAKYGDQGANTLGHLASYKKLNIPNLERLGIGSILPLDNIKDIDGSAIGCYGKAMEMSNGKDTTTGHFEICGLIIEDPFPVFPNGFPDELIERFKKANNLEGVLGNKVASGTVIINELGEEHIKTGYPIVYTSADSVFQIAAHEEVIPLERLYQICETTRKILTKPYHIGRVIARPFIGDKNGNFNRTPNRRDYTLPPPGKTLLDYLVEKGIHVYAIGKIEDIFSGHGISEGVHTKGNSDGIEKTIEAIKSDRRGLIFTNLVDFDMLYGHRNNPEGYAKALEEFDDSLDIIMKEMRDSDMLIITADHGCDPTLTYSTDHTREAIPILVYGKSLNSGINLGVRKSFADIGATIGEVFGISLDNGKSFLKDIIK